jgi:hypothetical protein
LSSGRYEIGSRDEIPAKLKITQIDIYRGFPWSLQANTGENTDYGTTAFLSFDTDGVVKQAFISIRSKTVALKVSRTAPWGWQGALEEGPTEGIVPLFTTEVI